VNFFRAVGRGVRLVGMFVAAGTELAVKRPATREQRAEWLHRFCARAMRGMGIEINVMGEFPERGAVISNHLSYLDIRGSRTWRFGDEGAQRDAGGSGCWFARGVLS